MNNFLCILAFTSLVLIAQAAIGGESAEVGVGAQGAIVAVQRNAQNQAGEDPFNIQWFREEMKISPKYLEKNQGVMGMSWAHFLTMVFLVIFFVGALIAVYMRNKRTKTILNSLLKEKEHESEG